MAGPGIRRRRPRRRAAHLRLAVPLAAVALLAAACTSSAARQRRGGHRRAADRSREDRRPAQHAGRGAARWLIPQLARLPLSDAQVRAHFDAAFLTQFSPAALNQMLEAAIRIDLLSIQVSQLSTLVANVLAGGGERAQVWLDVDSRGLISWLRISPANTGPTPATWAGVDCALRAVAPGSGCSWPTSATAPASPSTASVPASRRRSARPSSSTCSTRWATRWPRARSAGTRR